MLPLPYLFCIILYLHELKYNGLSVHFTALQTQLVQSEMMFTNEVYMRQNILHQIAGKKNLVLLKCIIILGH